MNEGVLQEKFWAREEISLPRRYGMKVTYRPAANVQHYIENIVLENGCEVSVTMDNSSALARGCLFIWKP